MNTKYRAKDRSWLAGALVVTALLVPVSVAADDGNLAQQLRVQQQKSRFHLMLEQVQQRASQRAVAGQAAAFRQASSPSSVGLEKTLGNWTESLRLHSISPASPLQAAPDRTTELAAHQAYERAQRRILDYRQQRRALIAGARRSSSNSFQARRGELARFNTQNQRLALQRKLRP